MFRWQTTTSQAIVFNPAQDYMRHDEFPTGPRPDLFGFPRREHFQQKLDGLASDTDIRQPDCPALVRHISSLFGFPRREHFQQKLTGLASDIDIRQPDNPTLVRIILSLFGLQRAGGEQFQQKLNVVSPDTRIPDFQSGQLTDVTVATLNLKTARSGFVPRRLDTILLNTECRSVVSKAFRDEKTFHL